MSGVEAGNGAALQADDGTSIYAMDINLRESKMLFPGSLQRRGACGEEPRTVQLYLSFTTLEESKQCSAREQKLTLSGTAVLDSLTNTTLSNQQDPGLDAVAQPSMFPTRTTPHPMVHPAEQGAISIG